MKLKYFNPNPAGRNVSDCAVRALCAALSMDWGDVYAALCVEGYSAGDMPHANAAWGAYLQRNGFIKHSIPESCIDCYTVDEFATDHPGGVYVLALSGHVVCVRDGELLDTWDSSHEIVLYYFEKER